MNRHILSLTVHALAFAAAAAEPVHPQSLLPDNSGTDALLFKDDSEFWFEIVRLFGASEYGGASSARSSRSPRTSKPATTTAGTTPTARSPTASPVKQQAN